MQVDAMKVWREAVYQYGGLSIEGSSGEKIAAAVIAQAFAERDAEIARLREAFLETRQFLGMLEDFVCEWSCPTQWVTAEGRPHSELHKDLQQVLWKHEAVRDQALGATDAA